MPKLQRDDATLHYEVTGTGPPLFLIAGMMSDGASWAPVLPLLEPHFCVYRPDNRSTGQTVPWDAPVSLRHWVEDLLTVMDHAEVPRVHVAGHSLGGMIGWALANHSPDRVASLSMLASAPLLSARNAALFRALIAIRRSDAPKETWLHALFPWLFGEAVFRSPGAIDMAVQQSLTYPFAQSVDAMERQLSALEAIPDDSFAQAPGVPMQALLAQDDLLIPTTAARAALGDIPITEIGPAGHSIHWDAPEQVAQRLRQFAEKHSL